jgi:hypothetical protein
VPGNTYLFYAGKAGYWLDEQLFVGTQVFTLGRPANQVAYVYSIVAFTNSRYSQVTYTTGVSLDLNIFAYAAGSGLDFHYTVSASTGLSSSPSPNGYPLEERDGFMSTGNFSVDSTGTYTINSAWLYGPRVSLDFGYFIPDYLTPDTATGGSCFFNPCVFSLQPGLAISHTVTISSSLTRQIGLDVSVGISVGAGVSGSVSVDLKTGVSVTNGASYSLVWTIYNTSSKTQSFEVYDEKSTTAGLITHIWTIK